MTAPRIGSPAWEEPPTYEDIVDVVIGFLRQKKALPGQGPQTPWDAFLRLSDRVHETYEVPATTLTPVMRRLLFALGFAARPRCLAGIGVYVGYAWSWLLRDRTDLAASPFFESAVGVDLDADAVCLAARNCAVLGHGDRLRFLKSDGVRALRHWDGEVDLLYLDIDDEQKGKSGYRDVVSAALPFMRSGALVLAHDPCVPRFQEDFKIYHDFVRTSGRFEGLWVLPVDPCGLSVALAR